jgi:hypothetical protein
LEIYVGLVPNFGVGRGTFAIICFALIGIVICFFRGSCATPNSMVFLGVALPVLVLLIIMALPKKSLSTDITQTDKLPTDIYMVRTGVISGLIFFSCVLLLLVVFCSNFTTTLVSKRMETQNLAVAQIEREKLQKIWQQYDEEVAINASADPALNNNSNAQTDHER